MSEREYRLEVHWADTTAYAEVPAVLSANVLVQAGTLSTLRAFRLVHEVALFYGDDRMLAQASVDPTRGDLVLVRLPVVGGLPDYDAAVVHPVQDAVTW